MGSEPKLITHVTDFTDFETNYLETGGLEFPELEKVMNEYILSQSRETMKFIECAIYHEQGEGMEVRTVQAAFHDHNQHIYIRLWGAKNRDNDQVLKMKVDAVNVETKQVVYERQLA